MKRNFPCKVQVFPSFFPLIIIIALATFFQVKAQTAANADAADNQQAFDFFRAGIKFLKEDRNIDA
ncbi:MAG: hypothetical protein M3384_14745, partial [Acidobacteriota bacterium]|nr:hypothetical protein [Acidobacteriota bacterium]